MREDTTVFKYYPLLPEYKSKLEEISKHVFEYPLVSTFGLQYIPDEEHQYARKNQKCQVFICKNSDSADTHCINTLSRYFNKAPVTYFYDSTRGVSVYAISTDDFIKKSTYTEELNKRRRRNRIISILILILLFVWIFNKLFGEVIEEVDL